MTNVMATATTAQKAITFIPATIDIHRQSSLTVITKRRTAGYARVSTEKDEQQTSQEAQVDYYTKYIKSRDDWEFICVYTDDGFRRHPPPSARGSSA